MDQAWIAPESNKTPPRRGGYRSPRILSAAPHPAARSSPRGLVRRLNRAGGAGARIVQDLGVFTNTSAEPPSPSSPLLPSTSPPAPLSSSCSASFLAVVVIIDFVVLIVRVRNAVVFFVRVVRVKRRRPDRAALKHSSTATRARSAHCTCETPSFVKFVGLAKQFRYAAATSPSRTGLPDRSATLETSAR